MWKTSKKTESSFKEVDILFFIHLKVETKNFFEKFDKMEEKISWS